MVEDIEILTRMLHRERMARKEAEDILEKKSFELETINNKLEELVELRTQELELLAKFPEHDPSPVMRINQDGIIDYANDSSNNLLSFWNAKVGEKCPPNIFIIVQKCLERGLNIELEIANQSDKGKIYSFILSPVKEFNYVFAYGRDITSLKKTQSDLNESKNVYQQLVEEASDVIHRTDLNGRFTYVNPVSSTLTEFTEEELIGKSYVSLIREDYKKTAIDFYKVQLQDGISETYFEFPVITKNGKELWVGQNSKLILKNSVPTGFHSVVRDITERRIAEMDLENTSNRLKILISNLQSAVLMEDENRKIVLVNTIFCDYFGIEADPSSIVGVDCSNSADQVKGLFKDPDLFVSRVNTIVKERVLVVGEEIELANGTIFKRDYIPIYLEDRYMGHLWKYTDITARKKSDDKLIEQKEFYENILNNIPTDIAVFDKNHKYLFLNPIAIKDPELRKWIVGKDDYEYVQYRGRDKSIADERRAKFEIVLQSKEMYKWEEKLTNSDGKEFYKLRHMCPVRDQNGEITNVIGIGLDITNERMIELELRRNERKLKIVNQISHELIMNQDFNESIHNALSYISEATGSKNINIYQHQYNQDSKSIEMNHRFGKSSETGVYTIEDPIFQGKNIYEVMNERSRKKLSLGKYVAFNSEEIIPIIHNHATKAVIVFPLIVLNHFWGSIVFEYQEEMNEWDNTTIDILSSFSNTIGGAISREETEEKLKAIVTSLDDIVLQINKNKEYENIWISDNSKLKFPKEKYINKYISDVVNPELAQIFENAIDEVLLTKEIRTFIYQSPENEKFYRCKICYLNQESVSALIQDITDQKKGEAELVKARERAEQSVKAKEHFLANMSHEIRTPMNAIVGMSRLLYRTPLNTQQNVYLNAINTSSKNLLIIINDILDFSKIESNKLTLENIGFRLTDVIQDVIKTINYRVQEKKLLLSYQIDPEITPVLMGDPSRLNQILLNLVNNAIKFTSQGSIKIKCEKESSHVGTNKIKFSVEDTGIGIGNDKLDKIFESFTQEDETITRQYGGTGLGLSICKELVELQGGVISVKSEKNKGTTFSFLIEYKVGTEIDIVEQAHKDMIEEDLTNTQVLLVEDNEINTFLAQTILENKRMLVDVAENGLIAIEKMKSKVYDIVLMDMQMPVMGGVEASKIIRNELKLEVPIIALTANAIKGDDKICLDAGMNDYVSKPFEEDELIRKISNLISKVRVENRIKPEAEVQLAQLYSLDKLKEMSRGNELFVTKMVNLFIDNTPEAISNIKSHFKKREFDKIKSIAHSIKPSIDFLSIQAIFDEIRMVESYTASDMKESELGMLIDKIDLTIEKVVVELKEHVKR